MENLNVNSKEFNEAVKELEQCWKIKETEKNVVDGKVKKIIKHVCEDSSDPDFKFSYDEELIRSTKGWPYKEKNIKRITKENDKVYFQKINKGENLKNIINYTSKSELVQFIINIRDMIEDYYNQVLYILKNKENSSFNLEGETQKRKEIFDRIANYINTYFVTNNSIIYDVFYFISRKWFVGTKMDNLRSLFRFDFRYEEYDEESFINENFILKYYYDEFNDAFEEDSKSNKKYEILNSDFLRNNFVECIENFYCAAEYSYILYNIENKTDVTKLKMWGYTFDKNDKHRCNNFAFRYYGNIFKK